MALAAAQPAEVLRAWQKDDLYKTNLAGLLSRVLPRGTTSIANPTASLLYSSFTTLKDLQTLGEEYSGIVQVDQTYHKLPTFYIRLLSILLSVFGQDICRKILKHTENNIVNNDTLTEAARNVFLVTTKCLSEMVLQFEHVHRALCYIYGGPIQLSKAMCGIDYIQVRPAASAKYAHLRILGLVTLAHSLIKCGKSLMNAREHVANIDAVIEDSDATSCSACLMELGQPCVLPCGHIFCMQCSYNALDTCALCRTPFRRSDVVPLRNYMLA